jgi:hypothetical protein
MEINEDLISDINYGMGVAHVIYNNKNYYGECGGGQMLKPNIIGMWLDKLLKPNKDGLWKKTKEYKYFYINNKNCKVITTSGIDGQNYAGGWESLGFKYCWQISELKRSKRVKYLCLNNQSQHREMIFIKKNSSLSTSTVCKILKDTYGLIRGNYVNLDNYERLEKEMEEGKKEIKRLKELLNKKKFTCTECYKSITYNNNFPLLQ